MLVHLLMAATARAGVGLSGEGHGVIPVFEPVLAVWHISIRLVEKQNGVEASGIKPAIQYRMLASQGVV